MAAVMEFRHLPVAGGLYDQHPALLDAWETIWRIKSAHDKREHAKKERNMGRGQSPRPTQGRAGRKRR